MRKSRHLFQFALLLFSSQIWADAVHICEDAGGWPPFLYTSSQSHESAQVPAQAEGLSVEVAKAIFREVGEDFDITLLPWKRCLQAVENGQHYSMILNASYNEERSTKFLYSEPYYEITPHVFYRKADFPEEGPDIERLDDLKKYSIGGILGYNYEYYGLQEKDIENAGIYNLEVLIARLRARQFDLFVENLEVIQGVFNVHGNPQGMEGIGFKPLPQLEPTPFYMIFTRNAKGAVLQKKVNLALDRLRSSGELEHLLQGSPGE